MIVFQDWKISCTGPLLAMQYDNLTRELRVAGDLPEGYDWAVLVQINRYFDIIALERIAGGAAAVLTSEQLSQSGYYTVQLRGTQNGKVRHTNTIRMAVGRSLSGDENWPEIPSEFTQIEQRVYKAMNAAVSSEEAAVEAAKQASDSERVVQESAASAAKSATEAKAGAAAAVEKAAAAAASAKQAGNSEAAAQASADSALSLAQSAEKNAFHAATAAEDAKANAEAAEISETNAKKSEQNAHLSADEARQAASNVSEAMREINLRVDEAAASAAASAQDKAAAETAAQDAETSAEEAAASAKRAEDAAANAGGGIYPGEIAGGAEAIATLAECGVLAPAYESGTLYTDGNGSIYIL